MQLSNDFDMEDKENADRVGKDKAFATELLFSMPRINKQIKCLREKGYPVKGILDIVQNENETNTIVYTSKYFRPCSDTFSKRYHFIGPSIRPITTPYEKTAEKTVYISMGTNTEQFEHFLSGSGYRKNADVISESFHSCGGVSEVREFLEDIVSSER